MMKKILFTLSVLCTVLWSCDTMDLSDVGYGDGDRLKSSDVKSLLYDTADGCWMADYQGHEFYFQFHKDGKVTLDSDFLELSIVSGTSYATNGKMVDMVIEKCNVHLGYLGSAFVDTEFTVTEVPGEGEALKVVLHGESSGNNIELVPTTRTYITSKVEPKIETLIENILLRNGVICDASGTFIAYYGVTKKEDEYFVKVISIENKTGNDTKGHTQYYESELTRDGFVFSLVTPVSTIKATNGKTYAFNTIEFDSSTLDLSFDGMTDVVVTSNKDAVKGFDYTSGNKYSMNQKNDYGDACDEIWEHTGSLFDGLTYDEAHLEGIDCMRYAYDVVPPSARPLCIWRDWYKNVWLPGSEEGASIMMNSEDKDWVIFRNINPSGIDHGPLGQVSSPAEKAKMLASLKNLLDTWFNEEGLFIVRVPNSTSFYLLCPDTEATANGGMWMKWILTK